MVVTQENNNSQINNGHSNITLHANPSSTSAFIGGFVGAVLDSTLYNPGSDGEVIAIHSDQVGGLAGSVKNTSIDMSWSRSKVSGRNDVGGLVGKLDEYSEIEKFISR